MYELHNVWMAENAPRQCARSTCKGDAKGYAEPDTGCWPSAPDLRQGRTAMASSSCNKLRSLWSTLVLIECKHTERV